MELPSMFIIRNPVDAITLITVFGVIALMFIFLALFPKESWILMRARFSKKKIPCLVANDAGILKIDLCEPGEGWINYQKHKYPIVDTDPEGVAKKRYILPGVKKPAWILYDTKALAMTPEHLKLVAQRENADKPVETKIDEKRAFLVLDPRDVRKDVKLRVHKSLLAYMLRNAEAAGYEEARKGLDMKTVMVFAVLIISAAIAFAIIYGTVFGPRPVAETIRTVTQTVNNSTVSI